MYRHLYTLQSTLFQLKHTCMHKHISIHTSSDHAYKTYMSAMYNFTFQWTWNQKAEIFSSALEPKTVCMPERCHIHCTASVVVRESIVPVYNSCFTWRLVTYAGPAAPPAPAMTSPARASTWISVKLRSAAWQHTPALLRNSLARLERLLLNWHRLSLPCWASTG